MIYVLTKVVSYWNYSFLRKRIYQRARVIQRIFTEEISQFKLSQGSPFTHSCELQVGMGCARGLFFFLAGNHQRQGRTLGSRNQPIWTMTVLKIPALWFTNEHFSVFFITNVLTGLFPFLKHHLDLTQRRFLLYCDDPYSQEPGWGACCWRYSPGHHPITSSLGQTPVSLNATPSQ